MERSVDCWKLITRYNALVAWSASERCKSGAYRLNNSVFKSGAGISGSNSDYCRVYRIVLLQEVSTKFMLHACFSSAQKMELHSGHTL